MENMRKFDIKYDYSVIALFSEHSETLIGGSEKAVKKAFKNSENPSLDTKGLDVFYQEKPFGTFAVDINQSALEIENIQNLVNKLYANLLDKRTNNAKIADTKITLDALFRADKRFIIRILARTISMWYDAVTDFYMNGKFGFAIPQKERAALGEQFYNDVNTLIETTFTVLKKKTSPQSNAEIQKIIKFNCTKIGEFLTEYSRYLARNKTFCICCKLCNNYFLANAWNARYCPECKLLRKKSSKKIYAEKCSEGVYKERQRIKFRFENFIHKNKAWKSISDVAKSEYKALHDEFVRTSAAMLKRFDEQGGTDLEREIECYLASADSKRANLECRIWSIR